MYVISALNIVTHKINVTRVYFYQYVHLAQLALFLPFFNTLLALVVVTHFPFSSFTLGPQHWLRLLHLSFHHNAFLLGFFRIFRITGVWVIIKLPGL